MQQQRIVDGKKDINEGSWEQKLRPLSFKDFPGQDKVKEKLQIFVTAAKKRGDPLDHTILCGPPGLGKTTLSHILAAEMKVPIKTTSGPTIEKKGDIAAILTHLTPNSILFIDEIHRLNRTVEEYLYSAMEDFYIDLLTGEGLGSRSMQFKLVPFTLIGATTRIGSLNAPFRDRFGIMERLDFYHPSALHQIVLRSAGLLDVKIDEKAAYEIATRCRGTPRIANRLLKRIRDYAQVQSDGHITESIARFALQKLEVDQRGLDDMDRKILNFIIEKFDGGPVGIETMASALSEEKSTLEDVYEPFLIKEGFLQKTPRGRVTKHIAYKHLDKKYPLSLEIK